MAQTEDLLAFVDTETTGLIPGRDQVLEIAGIITDLKLKELGRIEMKVKTRPGTVVDPKIAAINGYDAEVWEREARPFAEFREFLKHLIPFGHVAIPVGHNVGFDRDMIDHGYYKPPGLFCPLSYHKIDTVGLSAAMRLAGLLQAENLKLVTVAAALGVAHTGPHRAMGDCEAAKAIFERAVQALGGVKAA